MPNRHFSNRHRLHAVLFAIAAGFFPSVPRVVAQTFVPFTEVGDVVPMHFAELYAGAPWQVETVTPATDQLLERLLRTEERLAVLERERMTLQPATGGVPPDPADGPASSLLDDAKSAADDAEKEEPPAEKKWYEKYGIRGYAQFR